jgi:hypothetical protein
MNQPLDVEQALAALRASISSAGNSWDQEVIYGDEWSDAAWRIEKCFFQLITIADYLGLNDLKKMILLEYENTKSSTKGFMAASQSPDGEPYSKVLSKLRQFTAAIRQFFPNDEPTRITKDVTEILRGIQYVLVDKALFGSIPRSETDVHIRIEGVLKCVFPDLKHTPTVTKSVKSFQPDTGIPSIETLIEYKFLSCAKDVGIVADEILADTRGYLSSEWKRCIYVVYETNRFRSEKEWNQLLRQAGVPESTTIVVLSGEPSKRKTRKVAPRKADSASRRIEPPST